MRIAVHQIGVKGSKCTVELPISATTLHLPFDQFVVYGDDPWTPVDFTDAGYISLTFELFPDESCTVESFYVTPEPATLLLLGPGAVMLRRKRR